MKKRLLSILLTLVMALGLLPTAAFAADLPFTDVPKTAWFYSDVENAVASGLVNGKTATAYAPDDNLTYAEAVKLAACMYQKSYEGAVTLTNGSPWYQSYVDYAKLNGIITKDYNWTAKATRAGYMEIFANSLKSDDLSPMNQVADDSIPDVSKTHPQAKGIYALYRAGILQGSDAIHSCKPNDNIKRSEVAAILTRMMNPDKRISFSMGVIEALTITKQPQDLVLDAKNKTGALVVTVAGGTAPYQCQWYREDGTKVGTPSNANQVGLFGEARLGFEYDLVVNDMTLAGAYYCVIKDAKGATVTSDKAKATLVSDALTITQQPQPVALGDGVAEGSLSVTVSGGKAPYTYQWYKEGGTKVEDKDSRAGKSRLTITGSATAEMKFSFAMTTGGLTGTYYCVITDADGKSVTSNKAAIEYVLGLAITRQPQDVTVAEGSTATFTVAASGGKEPYTYQWYYKSTSVKVAESAAYIGTKTAALTIKNVSSPLSGLVFACQVTDADGKYVSSNPATLTVTATVPELTITKHPQNASVQETGTATFTVAATGGKTPYTYQWYYKSTSVKVAESAAYIGTKTATLTIKNISSPLNGLVFACQVTDADGKYVSSNPATLTVTAAPNTFEATVTNTTESGTLDGESITYIMASDNPVVATRIKFAYQAAGSGAADARYVIQLATYSDDYKTWKNSDVRNEKGPATGSLSIDMFGNARREAVKMRVKAEFSNGKTLYSDPVYLVYPLAARQWTGDDFSMICIDGGIGPFDIKWDEYNSQNRLIKCVGIDTTDVTDSYNGRLHILSGETIRNARETNSSTHTKISSWLGNSKYHCTVTDALGNVIFSREALYGNESNSSYYNNVLWELWESNNGYSSSLERLIY